MTTEKSVLAVQVSKYISNTGSLFKAVMSVKFCNWDRKFCTLIAPGLIVNLRAFLAKPCASSIQVV